MQNIWMPAKGIRNNEKPEKLEVIYKGLPDGNSKT